MNRNILLLEPNCKNKYPPIGLMKIATYHRQLKDNVTFYKGDLDAFLVEQISNEAINKLKEVDGQIFWEEQKQKIYQYIKTKNKEILKEIINLSNNQIFIGSWLNYFADLYKRYKKKDVVDELKKWDRIYVATLFTFNWNITIETINFAKLLAKNKNQIYVGGVMATVLSDEIEKETGIKPIKGLLDKPRMIDDDNEYIVDELPLDYSILDEIEYKYPENNGYYGYMTRGCINKCPFCAVSKIEPEYKNYVPIKENIKYIKENFGEKQNLLLLDNNVLASQDFPKIINEIKEIGFTKGSIYVEPNQLEITILNLKKGFNDKAYIKKAFHLFNDFFELIKKRHNNMSQMVYSILYKYNLLKIENCSKENIIRAYSDLAFLYEKYRHKTKRLRYVDFNQGLDATLFTEDKIKLLSEIPIRPVRIAFDHIELKEKYIKAIKLSAKHKIKHFSNYLLYNYTDKPKDLYDRLKINIDLCEELAVDIYSFPMRYIPLNKKDREYLGKFWNKKFIRAIQAILNATKGKVGRGKSFFEKAFGRNDEEFHELLYMPETYIIYRKIFEDLSYTQEWKNAYNQLTEDEKEITNKIIEANDFKECDSKTKNKKILAVLKHYHIKRDDVKKEDKEFKNLKEKFDELIKA
ncbi:MAG: hypothetical protein CVT89_00490 [Candidatus Altiarchaeales archaeon HGW-Altiarchaeales-2]|nr:MAG: hypothetical protein CVT89_00490 [Candidatus Altiarchaeales archaeon HGW-Altiarchaeales-2]